MLAFIFFRIQHFQMTGTLTTFPAPPPGLSLRRPYFTKVWFNIRLKHSVSSFSNEISSATLTSIALNISLLMAPVLWDTVCHIPVNTNATQAHNADMETYLMFLEWRSQELNQGPPRLEANSITKQSRSYILCKQFYYMIWLAALPVCVEILISVGWNCL